MSAGMRVLYVPPTLAGRQRTGTIRTISGVSALIQFDDCSWPQWAPLERLLPIVDYVDGWAQLVMITLTERQPK